MWVALAIFTAFQKPIGCRSLLQGSNMSIASESYQVPHSSGVLCLTIVQTLVNIRNCFAFQNSPVVNFLGKVSQWKDDRNGEISDIRSVTRKLNYTTDATRIPPRIGIEMGRGKTRWEFPPGRFGTEWDGGCGCQCYRYFGAIVGKRTRSKASICGVFRRHAYLFRLS